MGTNASSGMLSPAMNILSWIEHIEIISFERQCWVGYTCTYFLEHIWAWAHVFTKYVVDIALDRYFPQRFSLFSSLTLGEIYLQSCVWYLKCLPRQNICKFSKVYSPKLVFENPSRMVPVNCSKVLKSSSLSSTKEESSGMQMSSIFAATSLYSRIVLINPSCMGRSEI